MDEVREKVLMLISSILQVEEQSDIMGQQLISLGFTSLTFISLVVKMEEEFGVEFKAGNLNIRRIGTVDDLVKIVYELIEQPKE